MVTTSMLRESREGIEHWLKASAVDGESDDEANEVFHFVVSPQHTTEKIFQVLQEREEWLSGNQLPCDHQIVGKQRQEFHRWAKTRFLKQLPEQRRDDDNRRRFFGKGNVERLVRQAQRSRFQLEKQRRAGSSQIWELLSYTGKFSEEELQRLLEEVAKNAQRQQEDVKRNKELKSEAKKLKARWRYGNHLMRRLESKVGTVAQLTPEDVELVDAMKDGSMKRQVNEMVMQRGRGRLRGASATDYYDMGTNREFSAVQECLDGPVTRPDLSRFLS